ncbi:MAG: tetratricopeptide repeat protein, partial [Solirubrobacterales bacterium]|nr:tetratricopeptide repeat protein [Solirubrobacterales bacterium]
LRRRRRGCPPAAANPRARGRAPRRRARRDPRAVAVRARHAALPRPPRWLVRSVERLPAVRAARLLEALGLLAAIGTVLALGFAAQGRAVVVRAAGAVGLVALLPTLYFTFSRGALVALAAGLALQLALGQRRSRLVVGALVLGAPAALAVLYASRSGALTASGATLQTAQAEGEHLARRLLVLAFVASALVPLLGVAERRIRPRPSLTRWLAVATIVAASAVGAGAIVASGGPVELVERGVDSFSQPLPAGTGDLEGRLLSTSGNGRSDYWGVAAGMVQEEPLLGTGAGSFERYWLEERPTSFYARDAHNLYLETLAELGPVGLLVLVATLAVPLVALWRARRVRLAAAAGGAYGAFLVHAVVDWHWEVPGVTVAALLCAVALLAWAREPTPPLSRLDRRVGLALAIPLTAVALVAHVGNRALAASSEATANGEPERGAAEARRARAWAPWSHEPWQLLGQARLARNRDEEARLALRRALARDPDNWSIWYDLAIVSRGEERARALAQVKRLNPLSPEADELITEISS